MPRRTARFLLLGMLVIGAVPTASAQFSQSPAIDLRIAQPDPPFATPGEEVAIPIEGVVSFPALTYCTGTLWLHMLLGSGADHAAVRVEPPSIPIRMASPQPAPGFSGSKQPFKAILFVTPGFDAPAFRDGVYEVMAYLQGPGSLDCNVGTAAAKTATVLKNDYRAGLDVLGVTPEPDGGAHTVELLNRANGPTRAWMEPIRYDPFAFERLAAEDVVLEAGERRSMRIIAQAAVGEQMAVLAIRSTYAGEQLSHPSQEDVDEITIHAQGAESAPMPTDPAALPGFEAVTLLGLAAFALLRRLRAHR